MSRLISKRSEKVGLRPGSLVHIGERKAEKVTITVMQYDESGAAERVVASIDEIETPREGAITWIDVEGLHDPSVIEAIGRRFNIHSLILEDIVNTGGRPKTDDCGEYIFVRSRYVFFDESQNTVSSEQVSFILGERFVVSFQERPMDIFDPVQERIKSGKGRIRRLGADYLLYALLDEIVDHYFPVLERIGERIETLEDELTNDPSKRTLASLHTLRREMLVLKRSAWPLREVVGSLERCESKLMHDETNIFFRDVYDHSVQIMDAAETLRDMVSGMLDIYLSSMSNRINEVMRVLTVIATIFMPITFVAGLYGMNFKYMPELELKWGYPAVLAVMVAISVWMLLYFRRRKWL
ncbi:MAG: magnesium/cobalt transporter CorA [bacterium]